MRQLDASIQGTRKMQQTGARSAVYQITRTYLEVKLYKHNYTNYTVTFKGRGLQCIPETSLCFTNKFWQDKV